MVTIPHSQGAADDGRGEYTSLGMHLPHLVAVSSMPGVHMSVDGVSTSEEKGKREWGECQFRRKGGTSMKEEEGRGEGNDEGVREGEGGWIKGRD